MKKLQTLDSFKEQEINCHSQQLILGGASGTCREGYCQTDGCDQTQWVQRDDDNGNVTETISWEEVPCQ